MQITIRMNEGDLEVARGNVEIKNKIEEVFFYIEIT